VLSSFLDFLSYKWLDESVPLHMTVRWVVIVKVLVKERVRVTRLLPELLLFALFLSHRDLLALRRFVEYRLTECIILFM
jgi:hypothetical protein